MLAKNTQTKALHWLGKQLFNRNDPAAFFDPLLEQISPMLVQGHTPARIEQVIQETPDTRTFVLKPVARWAGFQAGQHINISVEVNGVLRSRTFSLSSSPELWAQQGLVTLTIKRLPGGLVTNWLHDKLGCGTVIGLGEAFGDFLLPQPPHPVLFIAGGSGITPVLSHLETMVAQDFRAPVTLLYFVRTHKDIIAAEQLKALESRYGALTLSIIATDESDKPRYLKSQDLEAVPGLKARQIFLCGPMGLMDLANELLRKQGVREQDIHSTFFSTAAPALSADLENQALGGKVQFEKSNLQASSEGDASLLEIAEASGLRPRHGCRMGICHQCSCRKTSGTVINRLTGQTSGPGEESVQLCISIPHGPVTIDV
ncbi:MAG: ferredoxin-NADP reductase [Marinobacter maritimus]|mgnify:CR=1 FL=1|jgi:ferredoxin-NADP reductase|uniref:ferredoxin reductase n=1 Tax=Marinobacter maritimus TaxID=277961 RepID=UPI0011AA4635|nr:ferredoxin reductase [Marinobacter maritimus]MBL1271082.1 ferredoxin reductase [Oceanospirillales bacterium]|tara:strand:- start:616 stop:1731 length:1116 start_codon:yes stop_codon:yes gene_type:complete